MENNEVVALSELNVTDENPLKVTYSASKKQITISGFKKMETAIEEDCTDELLRPGDIIMKNNDDDICGYILFG